MEPRDYGPIENTPRSTYDYYAHSHSLRGLGACDSDPEALLRGVQPPVLGRPDPQGRQPGDGGVIHGPCRARDDPAGPCSPPPIPPTSLAPHLPLHPTTPFAPL